MRTLHACLAAVLAAALGSSHAQAVARRDHFGDTARWALPLATALYVAIESDRDGLWMLGGSWAAAELATEALKRTVHDPRPDGTGKGVASGHAAGAFAMAGFLYRRYGAPTAAPAAIVAAGTAWSRVHTRHHFTRQVLLGAGVGLGSAAVFTTGRREGLALDAVPGGWALAYTARF